MQVHLGGHLAFYDRAKRTRFEMYLADETALLDVIRDLGVPEAEIALVAVNRTVVSLSEARLVDADRLDLYPPMSGGCEPDCWSRASYPVGRRLLCTAAATPRRGQGRVPWSGGL